MTKERNRYTGILHPTDTETSEVLVFASASVARSHDKFYHHLILTSILFFPCLIVLMSPVRVTLYLKSLTSTSIHSRLLPVCYNTTTLTISPSNVVDLIELGMHQFQS